MPSSSLALPTEISTHANNERLVFRMYIDMLGKFP